MTEPTQFLKNLLSLPGLSGHEAPVRAAIADAWQPLVDELAVSRVGSLHGLRRATRPTRSPAPRILISAHMDAIGLMVTAVVDGLLRFTQIGGVDARILPGQPVTVHARRDLPGVVVMPPERLLPPGNGGRAVEMPYLFVDTGLLPAEVRELVRPGDLISFAQPPLDLMGGVVAGHSLDNRASVAALTLCLQELQGSLHAWDVWALASVQEEVTLAGALTSPFEIRPDLAVALDVTFAKGPGVSDYRGYPFGKGPTLGTGPNMHPALLKAFRDVAQQIEMTTYVEPMAGMSGTDAVGLQVVAEGIPSMVVGIPLRYMHTPVEAVVYKDIQRTGRLLAEFIARLEADFVEKISWDA